MIKLLEDFDGSGLRDSHYSGLIRAHLAAYGAQFEFCRFYEIKYRRRAGIICLLNGSATADFCEGAKLREAKRELAEFVDFAAPESVELPYELAPRQGFSGYNACGRTFFEVSPSESAEGIFAPEPEEVFKTAFSDSNADYGLWLTDTMRRVNARQSALYGYKSSVLTVRFSDGGRAYITDVATPPEDRGKGYARTLLGGAARILIDSGMKAYLCAREDSAGFYRELGFTEIASDKIYIKG